MSRCMYYENGKCNVLGNMITIDCSTIKNSASDICRNDFTAKHNNGRRKSNKKNK